MATGDGNVVAFTRRAGTSPTVLWLGGFKSDMTGLKASALDRWAAKSGQGFVRFDYFGHGRSSGDFRDGTITRWRDDTLAVIDRIAKGPLVLVGSSMGGWLALLAAQARPKRVKTLLLIAPAVDFPRTLWKRLPQDARRQIKEKGEWLWPSAYDSEPYPITRGLIADGRRHRMLGSPIALPSPVHILHGMQDPDVPWTHSVALMETLTTEATLTLVREGDHRLSTPKDLKRMIATLQLLL